MLGLASGTRTTMREVVGQAVVEMIVAAALGIIALARAIGMEIGSEDGEVRVGGRGDIEVDMACVET